MKNLAYDIIEYVQIEMKEDNSYNLSYDTIGYDNKYSSQIQDYSRSYDQFRIRAQRRIEGVGPNETSRLSQSQG